VLQSRSFLRVFELAMLVVVLGAVLCAASGRRLALDLGHPEVTIVMLTTNTTLSRDRVSGFLAKTPVDIRSNVHFFTGVNHRDFTQQAEMVDRQGLAELNSQQKNNGKVFPPGSKERSPGAFACALGHYALWEQASETPGWTVVLEDDARVMPGMNMDKLLRVATSNQGGAPEFVWLEGRPCGPGFGTAAYALSQAFARDLLKRFRFHRVVDHFLIQEVAPRNAHGVCPPFADMPFTHGYKVGDQGLEGESEIRSA